MAVKKSYFTPRERNNMNLEGDWEWYQQFCGIEQSSNYYTNHIFSTIINENPAIKRIIELGTYTGSMAIALGLEGVRKGIEVQTFNCEEQTTAETQRILNKLDVIRNILDIFEPPNIPKIKALFDKPVYLLCDNGNKRAEFHLFVQYLKPGSVVSVHDYGVEFMPKDADVHSALLTPFREEDWQNHNVQLASWVVK